MNPLDILEKANKALDLMNDFINSSDYLRLSSENYGKIHAIQEALMDISDLTERGLTNERSII